MTQLIILPLTHHPAHQLEKELSNEYLWVEVESMSYEYIQPHLRINHLFIDCQHFYH